MKNISFKNSLIILILISSGFVLTFYSPVVFHPNQYLFSPNGDGISSYYNSIYHIEHDSSYLNFEGMNYPYGEHITYSVNNPLFTNIIKWLNGFFPGLNNYTVGIFNFSMIFSFILTAFFLFIIFNQLKINIIVAILSSVAIMALSPQIFRMQGHLSLAYGFFIPLTLWILLQSFVRNNKVIWLVILFFNSILWILIHPYYTGIIAAFLLCFAVFQLLIKSETLSNRFYYGLALIVISILPLLLYKIFLNYTDNHLFRTTKPWGFLIFTAEPEGVFLPHHPPLRKLAYSIFNMNDQNWEGLAYIGIANNIVIICTLLILLISRIKSKINFRKSSIFQNRFINIAALSSIVVLFFSMGLPFVIFPGYVPKFLNFLNEFRSPGRFAWVFFYIVSIFCVWIVNQWLIQSLEKRTLQKKYLLVGLFIIFPFIEAIPVHIDVGQSISQTPNYLSIQNSDFQIKQSLEKIKLEDYQAILPLPFYHRGSEVYTKSPTAKILLLSELLSYKIGLPIMSSYLARTSISESKKLIQTLSPAQYPKPVKDEISSKKPFLIIYSKEELSKNEKNILARAEFLCNNNEFSLYKLEFDSLFKTEESVEDSTEKFLVSVDFENSVSDIHYNGKGAMIGHLDGWTQIYYINPDSVEMGIDYEISFWMYNCGENEGQDQINSTVFLNIWSKKSKKTWPSIVNPAYSEIIDGCWSKVSMVFRLDPKDEKPYGMYLMIDGYPGNKKLFIIDKFRIKELKHSD